jgi:23S rRNA (cytidine1920-2'-O)/16S rRNA (cytidine1409-2'-O)-methyltransferase
MKIRIDQRVHELGLADSREKAKRMIMAGQIFVDGQEVNKPGTKVDSELAVTCRDRRPAFVSRGGHKLQKAVEGYGIDLTDKVCMDIGASTGGFTQVMLNKGARKVFSVDVGYGQLDYSLRTDPRVVNLEKTNARYLAFETIGEKVDFISVDVSFISVKKVVGALEVFMKETTELVVLIKPQFEAGRDIVKKKGVVKDPGVHRAVLEDLVGFLTASGIHIRAVTYSPITGPKGNIEFLVYGAWGTEAPVPYPIDLGELVTEAHENLLKKGGSHEV